MGPFAYLFIYLLFVYRQELEEQIVRPRRSYEKDITSPRGRRSFEKDTPKYIYPATPEDEVVRASYASQLALTARALSVVCCGHSGSVLPSPSVRE